MDLFDKLNAGLEPLGGPLFVDAFVAARQVEQARRAEARKQKPAVMQAAQGSSRATSAPRREPAPPAAASRNKAEPPADEMEAFLNRDAIEGADDAEVQEFLKERAGFDPTELE